MKDHHNCLHQTAGLPLFRGPELSRRAFVRLAGTGIMASWFLPEARASERRALNAATQGTAKNCIFLTLTGAPSHIDTFDLKEGPWTPSDFAPMTFRGSFRWPLGLMPDTALRLDEIAIVRSCLAWAAVHDIAMVWAQIARNPTSALGGVAPHIGSVVASELESRRDPQRDVLPPFISFNSSVSSVLRGGGYYPSRYAPFVMPDPRPEGLPVFNHPGGRERFARRWQVLDRLDGAARRTAPFGKQASDAADLYEQARTVVQSEEAAQALQFTADELSRYVPDDAYSYREYGATLLLAYKLLAARRGTRFIHVAGLQWDSHIDIYSPPMDFTSIYGVARAFDKAFAALLNDLRSTPGEEPGRTMLDETLIVAGGEFGRTVGPLNAQRGRDHHLRHSLLFAGGGVRGGRAIGKTDAAGDQLVDSGWSKQSDTRAEDIAATVYSALGIDYTTIRYNDPIGRGFEYVPYAREGEYKPIDELFE